MKNEEQKAKAVERTRLWRLANKERDAAYKKEYSRLNKEKRREITKRYQAKLKDGFYRVYLLPKENYVGQTSCMSLRLNNHKSAGRDIANAKVLGKYKTKREALDAEASYHAKGYKGGEHLLKTK